jgi:hypothetical protein
VRAQTGSFTVAVAAGLAVSMWEGPLEPLLWHGQTRTEGVSFGNSLKDGGGSFETMLAGRYVFR